MIRMLEPMMNEIDQEAVITRRVLERVPSGRLSWKPHRKSMSLGQLAFHVASIPGNVSKLAQLDELDASAVNIDAPSPNNSAEILTTLDASINSVKEYLECVSEPAAVGNWRLIFQGKEVFAIPRLALLRTIMLNHW